MPSALAAGPWTMPKGVVRLKTGLSYQSTNTRFCTAQDAASSAFREAGCTTPGQRAPFDPFVGGAVQAVALTTELMFGVNGWFDAGLQVPYYSIRFVNLADPERPRTSSFGDIRLIGKARIIERPFLASLELALKSPTGEFTVDSEVVNVSEKQWDFDALAEVGKSFWPLPLYIAGGIGYRFRSDNRDFEQTFANERLMYFEAGYNVTPRLLLKGYLHWLRGGRPQVRATGTNLLWRRALLTLTPSFLYSPVDNIALEAGLRFALAGEDFPSGRQVFCTISYDLQLLN
jgi:hypothetical protein